MTKKLGIAVVMLQMLMAICTAEAAILWGVTNGVNDGVNDQIWKGGEIFALDTETGVVDVKQGYDSAVMDAFGDIAVSTSGDVYVTYDDSNQGFDKLARVDTTTWDLELVYNLGGETGGYYPDADGIGQVNALEFIGGALYGVTGGGFGVDANLLRFDLDGSGVTSITNLGSLGTDSSGDITQQVGGSGEVYYTSLESWPDTLSTFTIPDPGSAGSVIPKTGKLIDGGLFGWGALAFDNGTLYAGTYMEQKIYTLDYDTANAMHTATLAFNLDDDLGGNITGFSDPPNSDAVPEPGTLLLLGSGLAGIVGYGKLMSRRKKR